MNKLLIAIGIILLGIVFLFQHMSEETCGIHIAIITPASHHSLEEIERGFKETLKKSSSTQYIFKTYNAQGNRNLMRGEIEDISRKSYALVLAIGSQAAKMSKEVLEKKGVTTPIVFTAVPDPLELGLIAQEESSNNQLTGVKESTHFEKEFMVLNALGKKIKKVLLVFDPTQPCLQRDKETVENILASKGIALKTVEIFKTNELLQKVTSSIEVADAMLVLKDNTVIPGLDILVKLCKAHKLLLLASDLDSIDRGASIAFGVKEYVYGEEAAKKALLIIEKGYSPSSIPTTPIPLRSFEWKINEKALEEQGAFSQHVITFCRDEP